MNDLTIVIPFFNGENTIKRLIESLPYDVPVLIIDDQSDRPLQNTGWRHPRVNILRPRQKGYFAGAVNEAIRQTRTDLLILNQDTWFDDFAWQALIERQRKDYALIGERIRGEHPVFPGGYVHGTFMFMRRDAIDAVGLLNAQDYPLWGNTAEWQWRLIRKGYTALATTIPGFHHERAEDERFGSSIQQLLQREPARQKQLIRTPPLLSVIVPCYNYGRYLPDCIASLVGGDTSLGAHPGQTLQSFEVIIVNDCSTDDSAAYIDRVRNERAGIFAYKTPRNGGTAAALNFGIDRAHGEFVTFLSADDMREPDSLRQLVDVCQATSNTFAYDDIRMFGHGKRLRQWRMEEFNPQRLLFKNHIHAGIVFTRRAWVLAGGYPEVMRNGREDWAFNLALVRAGFCAEHVRQYGYLYRREEQNRSLTNTSPEHHAQFLAQLQRLFPSLYETENAMASCCNGRRQTPTKATVTERIVSMAGLNDAGTQGFVRLEYVGKQQDATWAGEVTHTQYVFGMTRRIGYVDPRDAGERPSPSNPNGKGFLSKRRNGEYLFQVYNAKQAVSTPLVQVVNEQVEPAQAGETQDSPALLEENGSSDAASAGTAEEGAANEPQPLPVLHPEDFTVATIQAQTLTQEQWKMLLANEKAGKNRVTVIEFAEQLIGGS